MIDIYMKFYNKDYTEVDELCCLFSEILNNTDEEKVVVYNKEILEGDHILYLKNHAGLIKKFYLLNNDIYDNIIEKKSIISLINISDDESDDEVSLVYGSMI